VNQNTSKYDNPTTFGHAQPGFASHIGECENVPTSVLARIRFWQRLLEKPTIIPIFMNCYVLHISRIRLFPRNIKVDQKILPSAIPFQLVTSIRVIKISRSSKLADT